VPDWLIVAEEKIKKAYERLGVPADRIHKVGYMHVDYIVVVRAELDRRGRASVRAEILPDEASDRFVIVFVAEQFSGIDLVRSYQERIFLALEAVLAACSSLTPRPYVVVRLHPKNQRNDLARYADRIDFVSHGGDGLLVVYSGDMVIGSTSTLLFEAALLGRPTVSFLPHAGDHENLPSITSGVTCVVLDIDNLRQEIAEIVTGKWQAPAWPRDWQVGARERLADYLQSRLSV
jgi:hypothetical protein